MRGVIESMTGARFVRDTLEGLGWEVLVADAQKVKGLAPLRASGFLCRRVSVLRSKRTSVAA